ncbi:non-SMC condensin II complex, subunit D3, partial [Reticulomyxa filosa]
MKKKKVDNENAITKMKRSKRRRTNEAIGDSNAKEKSKDERGESEEYIEYEDNEQNALNRKEVEDLSPSNFLGTFLKKKKIDILYAYIFEKKKGGGRKNETLNFHNQKKKKKKAIRITEDVLHDFLNFLMCCERSKKKVTWLDYMKRGLTGLLMDTWSIALDDTLRNDNGEQEEEEEEKNANEKQKEKQRCFIQATKLISAVIGVVSIMVGCDELKGAIIDKKMPLLPLLKRTLEMPTPTFCIDNDDNGDENGYDHNDNVCNVPRNPVEDASPFVSLVPTQ